MIKCAFEISKIKPTLWWLHESSAKNTNVYIKYREIYPELDNTDWMDRLRIVAVSNRAKKNFEYYYPGMVDEIMPLGLRDDFSEAKKLEKGEKVVFTIVGGVSKIKGQDIFVEAAKKVEAHCPGRAEFWIVGDVSTSSFAGNVRNSAKGTSNFSASATFRKRIPSSFLPTT